MTTITRKIQFKAGRGGNNAGRLKTASEGGRVPRVSRLMALAIRLDRLIQSGEVADQAELARLGHVTRARLTQIMNLLQLAPDVQEAILFLPVTERGRDNVTERDLRAVVNKSDWRRQRRKWKAFSEKVAN